MGSRPPAPARTGVTGRPRPRAVHPTRVLGLGVLVLGLLWSASAGSAPPVAGAGPRATGVHGGALSTRAGPPTIRTVTLVTGDVVRVTIEADGRRAVVLEPGPTGTVPQAAIFHVRDHLYVFPQAAMNLLSAGRLDRRLFDVNGLIADGFDDAHQATIPVIVDYGRGLPAGRRANLATIDHARKTVTLGLVGAAAFEAPKRTARGFWRSLTTGPDASGAPTALADGAVRVDLDGVVHATLDPSVGRIGAPAAWAAGFDGTGTTVAVLDTGYDATHPDLVGVVVRSANFSPDPTVADGNGHGTHVASTIAGTGAAEPGVHGGVAPGTRLMIGKVLDHTGTGEDSAVLAGMQWAVANGADVVSMSLGGDASDGTDPLSRAIDDLSASSKTLFVVAAGNAGPDPETVSAPGAAEAALTVGAVDGEDQAASFSGRGPRLGDGGTKPDVVAPGVGIVAARASGTSLGDPVDAWYTALSGTSMATPHVAGLAAILKQEHPGWDGERIKALITSTAVAVGAAGAFDVGTGRIDAARAIVATVVAEPSLDLGYYAWPHDATPPTRTPLAYTNVGSAPVTLALSVAAEDGTSDPPPGVSLGRSTLTVPAGGSASVDVVVDPRVAGVGSYSGVVVADPGPAGTAVRTAFGFGTESERYDLAVRLRPRDGSRLATHTVGLLGLDNGTFDERSASGDGEQVVRFRVEPGAYSVADIGFDIAGDRAAEGVLTFRPSVQVTRDTEILLDGRVARRFDVRTDRPAISDGLILSVDWASPDSFTTFTLAGGVDRVFAQPLASSAGGQAATALDWMLSQPDAELSRGPAHLNLRSIAPAEGRTWDVPIPVIDGRYRLVDAGSAAKPSTAGVRDAIALVAGACGDLTPTAATLAAAGAAAMIAYPAPDAMCAGTLEGPAPLPAFQARPFEVSAVEGPVRTGTPAIGAGSSAGGTGVAPLVSLVSHPTPAYIYDLAGWWPDSVPAGATLDGRTASVASLVERYDTLGGSWRDGLHLQEMLIGWIPGRGAAAYGLVRPVRVPAAVIRYASPISRWERAVEVQNTTGGALGMLWAPAAAVRAGSVVTDRWFGGPLGTSVSPRIASVYGWEGIPNRQGDTLYLYLPPYTDTGGHAGSPLFVGEFEGRLYRDGDLAWQADDPLWLWGDVSPGRHDYRLTYRATRQNVFWGRSTDIRTEWRFSSARPRGDHAVIPLITVGYDLPLGAENSAPAGTFAFGLRFGVPRGATAAALRSVTAEISWNGGRTWSRIGLTGCTPGPPSAREGAAGACRARVTNRTGQRASLRIRATDRAGRSVSQTVVGAYLVR